MTDDEIVALAQAGEPVVELLDARVRVERASLITVTVDPLQDVMRHSALCAHGGKLSSPEPPYFS